jgi:hypothetical protein
LTTLAAGGTATLTAMRIQSVEYDGSGAFCTVNFPTAGGGALDGDAVWIKMTDYGAAGEPIHLVPGLGQRMENPDGTGLAAINTTVFATPQFLQILYIYREPLDANPCWRIYA